MPGGPSVKGRRLSRPASGVAVRCTGQASRRVLGVLAVKGNFLTINLSHKLGANCHALLKFSFGLAL